MRLKRWILILLAIVCLNGAIEAQPVTLILDHISNNKDQGSPVIDKSRNSFTVTEKYNEDAGRGTVAITVALGSATFTSGVPGSAPGAGFGALRLTPDAVFSVGLTINVQSLPNFQANREEQK